MRPTVLLSWIALFAAAAWVAVAIAHAAAVGLATLPLAQKVAAHETSAWTWSLQKDQAVEIRIGVAEPSKLPPNARVAARWTGPQLESFRGERGDLRSATTADWSKTLHALDPDLTLVYKAP